MKPTELIEKLRSAECNGFPLVDKELKPYTKIWIESNKGNMNDYVFLQKKKNRNLYIIYSEELDKIHLCNPSQIHKIYNTPPSMSRILAFIYKKYYDKAGTIEGAERKLIDLFLDIDHTGSHDFFWLIENAEEHYAELLKFCKTYIL